MNQENALPRRKAMLYYPSQAKPRPVRLREKDRDPYDGLRPWSAITHGIGAALALLGTVLLLLRCAALSLSPWHVVSFLIYGVSMVGLIRSSTLYHCRNVSVKGRIALRKYDHASIYFLIAGTYTPICLVVLRTDGAWGWRPVRCHLGLGPGRAGAHPGLDHRPPLAHRRHLYLHGLAGCGGPLVPLLRLLPPAGFFWVLGGGILLHRGRCVLYAVNRPGRDNPRFGCHEIFHLFILMGSVVSLHAHVPGGRVSLSTSKGASRHTAEAPFCAVIPLLEAPALRAAGP